MICVYTISEHFLIAGGDVTGDVNANRVCITVTIITVGPGDPYIVECIATIRCCVSFRIADGVLDHRVYVFAKIGDEGCLA